MHSVFASPLKNFYIGLNLLAMKISRTNFICLFLIFGFTYLLLSILLLNQQPDALFATTSQANWQAIVSNILSPFKIILIGPLIPVINYIHQNPDTPPPFYILGFIIYWSLLAFVLYFIFSKAKVKK